MTDTDCVRQHLTVLTFLIDTEINTYTLSPLHTWCKWAVREGMLECELLTVWQGTVRGLWLGAVAAVCLICLVRCSTQSCRSCWFEHITWRRSNIEPAWTQTAQLENPPMKYLTSCLCYEVLPLSSKAFLWASQSSSLVTDMPAKGSFPCNKKWL